MSSNLWNDSNLPQPPINTYKAPDNGFDTTLVRLTIEEAITLLSNQQSLQKDSAILSRLHYKMGTKFRHDIGYAFLRKTHCAVSKYSNIKLSYVLQTFLDVLTSIVDPYLPTRQMFEYILLRLQAFAKLLQRIVTCSEQSATYFFDRIKRGDAWWLSFMPFTVLSRIWYIARHLLKNACKWYDGLVPFRRTLMVVGVPLVPPEYIFPDNLNSWLDGEASAEESAQTSSKNDDSRLEEIKNTMTYVAYANKKDLAECDLGESVSRESFIENVRKCKRKESLKKPKEIDNKNNNLKANTVLLDLNKCSNNFNELDTVKAFKRWLKKEELYRKNDSPQSTTLHLSLMQWQSLKAVLQKIIGKANDCNEKVTVKKLKSTIAERISQ